MVTDAPARLVDLIPTMMAALGAPTTAGVGPDGAYDDRLYLRRQDGAVLWDALNPHDMVENPADYIRDPSEIYELYDRVIADDIETLSAAIHRAFGAWEPETGAGGYTAVINEMSIGDADRTTFDEVGGAKAGIEEYRLADDLAVTQVEGWSSRTPTALLMSRRASVRAGCRWTSGRRG